MLEPGWDIYHPTPPRLGRARVLLQASSRVSPPNPAVPRRVVPRTVSAMPSYPEVE